MKYFIKILFFIALVWVSTTLTCGGNCPGGKCPSCPCGLTKNVVSAALWCSKFTRWNQACCRCIVTKQSGGNSNAMNYNTNGSFDVGLWQINKINWTQCNGGKAPCTLTANLACAKKVWAWGGNSFRLWSTSRLCGGC